MTGVLQRQLRDFAVAALLAVAIASAAFVVVRNGDVVDAQLELAQRSAHAVASGQEALPTTHVALVGPSQSSTRHPILRHRDIRQLGEAADRHLDKLFYDAALRIDREHKGAFVEMLHDGTGRAIAATTRDHGPMIVVAVTDVAKPAPYPLLVMIGVLGLGALLAAAGALVGRAAARAGTLTGIATLAIPALLWHAWIAATAIILLAAATTILQRAELTDQFSSGMRRHRVALGFLAPVAVAMFVLVAVPFVIGIVLGFYDHHQGTWTYVGLQNFRDILGGGTGGLDDGTNFWFVLGVTVLWTGVNLFFHVTIGVALALVLSRSWLRGKGVFRMLLILPWAIPNYITALIWKGMFQGEYGAVNSLLHAAHLDGVSWFTSWSTAFSANVITNTWLGFPFMMVVALGALETIPKELYEAASVDGASAWQRFRHITLPHLRPALGPAVALGSIWTFNMFNVIFLVSGGKPGDTTNILVTDAYRWAFERGDKYGLAAAYATLIFLILRLLTILGSRLAREKEPA